mgnify:CR=1 FL=1
MVWIDLEMTGLYPDENTIIEIATIVTEADLTIVAQGPSFAISASEEDLVKMDEWNIDALYSGTQKCLSCPPGLSPVSFSDRAVGKLTNRKTKVPNWYLDLSMITQYWSGKARVYHHTAPFNMLYGLYQACYSILEEGLENVIQRHKDMHELLVSELKTLGLELFVEESARLPMLNAVKIPEGVDDVGVRARLLKDYHIEIGGGLGPLAGKIWRIGLMGETAKKENIQKLMDAFRKILN